MLFRFLLTYQQKKLVVESIKKRWENIAKNIKIPKKEFFIAIKLILESTYFSFNKKCYRQIFGSPMGSSLSPIITNIVMEDLEEKAFQLLSCRLLFYFRYVDDILLAAPPDSLTGTLEIFNLFQNAFNSRLK